MFLMSLTPYAKRPTKTKKLGGEGAQNVLLTADQKDQLRRDRHIISFEQEPCCEFDKRDLDTALLAEFRKVFHTSVSYKYTDEELLYHHPAPEVVRTWRVGALARLSLGGAYVLQGDREKARVAYQDFLTLWKDADAEIPVLKQAKAEYAKLE